MTQSHWLNKPRETQFPKRYIVAQQHELTRLRALVEPVTQLPQEYIRCIVQNRTEKHDILHTCTMILSKHYQVHRHLCTDRLWL